MIKKLKNWTAALLSIALFLALAGCGDIGVEPEVRSLTISVDGQPVALNPTFSQDELTYTVNLTTSKQELEVTVESECVDTPIFSKENTLKYNAQTGRYDLYNHTDKGQKLASVTIDGKTYTNMLTVIAAAGGGIQSAVYTVTFNVKYTPADALAGNADLTLLKVTDAYGNERLLSPTFAADTLRYTLRGGTVLEAGRSVTLRAEAAQEGAAVAGTGTFPLQAGENNFTVSVTSPDKTQKKEYVVSITAAEGAKSGDATLAGLQILNAAKKELTLSYSPETLEYTAELKPVGTDNTVIIYATPTHPAAQVEVKYIDLPNAYPPLALGKENHTFVYSASALINYGLKLTVTAEDGSKKAYTLKFVAPALSGDWTLSTFSVQLADGTVHDLRDPNSRRLTVTGAQTVVFQALPSHPKAQVTGDVGEQQVTEGVNQFNFVSTAENGETQNFLATINVTKPAAYIPPPKNSNAALASLTVTLPDGRSMNLNPGFAPETNTYVAEAPGDTAYVVLTGTPQDPAATLAGVGMYMLNAGKNDLTLTVTAEDGTTVNTYTVSIYAGAAPVPDLDPDLDPEVDPDLDPAPVPTQ